MTILQIRSDLALDSKDIEDSCRAKLFARTPREVAIVVDVELNEVGEEREEGGVVGQRTLAIVCAASWS